MYDFHVAWDDIGLTSSIIDNGIENGYGISFDANHARINFQTYQTQYPDTITSVTEYGMVSVNLLPLFVPKAASALGKTGVGIIAKIVEGLGKELQPQM